MHMRELVTTTKRSEESMQDYIGRITVLIRKCAKADLVFGEKADAFFYLLGLPSQFEDFSRSLERDEVKLTPRMIKAKLLAEEKRMARCMSPTDAWKEEGVAQALLVKSPPQPRTATSGTYDHPQCRRRSHHMAQKGMQRPARHPLPHAQRCSRDRQEGAHPSRRGARGGTAQRGGSRRACRPYQHGGRKGHHQDGGPQQTTPPTYYKCYNCGRQGHFAKSCPSHSQHSMRMAISESAIKSCACVSTNVVKCCESGESGPKRNTQGVAASAPSFQSDAIALCVTDRPRSSADWFIDTGASDHMCPDTSLFKDMNHVVGKSVRMGNGNKAAVTGIGQVEIILHSHYGGRKIILSDVLCVPELGRNLLSVGKLTRKGARLTFEGDVGTATLKGTEVFTARKKGEVYVISTLAQNCSNRLVSPNVSLNALTETPHTP